jgi:hypothetical protein
MAIEKRIIPIPPSHWIMLLQKSIDFGRISTFAKTVDPVVVKPETVSKYVSVKEGKVSAKRKGSEPNKVASTHPKVTIIKPSRCDICFFRGLKNPSSKRPVNRVAIAAGKKDV